MFNVGCSGYDYKWIYPQKVDSIRVTPDGYLLREKKDIVPYYPHGMKKKEALGYYSKDFRVLELNCTFYRLPTETAVKRWYEETPDGFKFIVKFSKYSTHSKKLNGFEEHWNVFMERVGLLKEKLAGVLVQLPPQYKNNNRKLPKDKRTTAQRLMAAMNYTKEKTPDLQIFAEFRDTSWFTPSIYELFTAESNWNMVYSYVNNTSQWAGNLENGFNPNIYELPMQQNELYFRLHGDDDYEAYKGIHTTELLVEMVTFALDVKKTSYFFFDNTDDFAAGSMNASVVDVQGELEGCRPSVNPNVKYLPSFIFDAARVQRYIELFST